VLVIDLDGQANASTWLGTGASADHELLDALLDARPLVELVQPTAWAGVDVIAANPRLKAAETALRTEPGAEHLLRTAIDGLKPDDWDHLLIDCPRPSGPQYSL